MTPDEAHAIRAGALAALARANAATLYRPEALTSWRARQEHLVAECDRVIHADEQRRSSTRHAAKLAAKKAARDRRRAARQG